VNIHEKMLAIMEDAGKINKDLTVNMGGNKGYNAVSHDEVASTLRPLFIKYKVIPLISEMDDNLDGNMAKVKIKVRFINVESPEEFIEVPSF
jgi:hypothetical protein